MPPLEQFAHRALSPVQQRALARMDVDIYQRRQLPRSGVTAQAPAAESAQAARDWSAVERTSPLARALARAGGMVDAAAWSASWLQAGLPLPDLTELRAVPAAKRALWRLMRARR